ncbi:MAG: FAD-binding protein [Proteobacteria bacterium]|nr:FAD-binding protein [Pseudomonadota bacterium]
MILDKRFDVVVVGSGGAGLRAAIEAKRRGARVAVVTKGMALHSGATESANFSYCAHFGYFGPSDSAERFAEDIVAGGAGMSQPGLARLLAERAGGEALELKAMGMPWDEEADGRFALASFAGHAFPRAIHVDLKTGKAMMATLGRAVAALDIPVWEHVFAADVLVTDGAVAGLVGVDIRSGTIFAVPTRAVVLATGGAMEIYELQTNPTELTGDGVALAYRCGARLVDMEFFQSYPTVFVAPPGARGVHFPTGRLLDQGAKLVNARGEEFFARYETIPVNRATRDTLSRVMALEARGGGATPRGGMFLDATGLPADVVRSKFVESYFADLGIDPCREPQEVAPAPHYMMGGVWIDEACRTSVAGLFAAGETAGGVHGANRLTGTALPETVVFGAEAGRSAAQDAATATAKPIDPGSLRAAARRIEALRAG